MESNWFKYKLAFPVFKTWEQYLSVVSAFQDVPVVVQLVCHCWAVDLHTGCENHQLIPLAHLCTHAKNRGHNGISTKIIVCSEKIVKDRISKRQCFMTACRVRVQYNVKWWQTWLKNDNRGPESWERLMFTVHFTVLYVNLQFKHRK